MSEAKLVFCCYSHLPHQDGAFLVRDCSVNTNSEPLVLAVYHEKKVYNVKIRFIERLNKYALGTGQRSNDVSGQIQKDGSINTHTPSAIYLL